jgi:predicted transcriptional regulator
MEIQTLNQNNQNNQNNQIKLNKSYEEYVEKAIQEGLEDINTGKTQDFETAMKELDSEFE